MRANELHRLPAIIEHALRPRNESYRDDGRLELERAAEHLRESQKLLTLGRLTASIVHTSLPKNQLPSRAKCGRYFLTSLQTPSKRPARMASSFSGFGLRANGPDQGVRGLRITVADNGSGISAEARKRLGEPFFTTKGQAGTGLGLWVTRSILRRYRGSLQVRSSALLERARNRP